MDLITTLVAQQAARAPYATALRSGHSAVTYGELEGRVQALAGMLAGQGIGAGHRVAVGVPRSPDMVAAVLAIMRAGAAFVPVDFSQYPPARNAFIIRDSAASLVMTTAALRDRVPSAVTISCLDEPLITGEPLEPPAHGVTLADTAYVLYTSGSTGVPKGVVMPHAGIANYVRWAAKALPPAGTAESATILHSPLTFDFSLTSMFVPLVRGEPVTLLPSGSRPTDLIEAMAEPAGHAFVRLTPSHLRALYEAAASRPPRCRAFVIGGESLPGELLQRWAALVPDAVFINHYGPTETAVGRCAFAVPGAVARHWADTAVPIGHPIDNTGIRLLDPAGCPVPLGSVGEIHISGAGLADGYTGGPGMTAEKFVPDPFAAAPGSRMYRTGDLAYQRPDGSLVFAGRADGQVKIRGHRVEPAEVETLLAAAPAVAAAAVIARPGGDGDSQLTAYLVAAAGHRLSPSALRSSLAGQLPDFMVPTAYVLLDAMPLTAHGKVDRAALPEPPVGRPDLSGFAPPADGMETALARLWMSVLNVRPVGRNDNFFELGGTSVLAMRVSALAAQEGIPLEPESVFEYQTIAELAGAAAAGRSEPFSAPA